MFVLPQSPVNLLFTRPTRTGLIRRPKKVLIPKIPLGKIALHLPTPLRSLPTELLPMVHPLQPHNPQARTIETNPRVQLGLAVQRVLRSVPVVLPQLEVRAMVRQPRSPQLALPTTSPARLPTDLS